MTAKGNHSTPAKPVVLFGIDSRGKPKAARFSKEYAGLAIKAANQLALQVLSGNHPNLADIAARLPVGRVHATGRTFVPFIGHDLYNQLVAAAGNGDVAQSAPPPSSGASGSAAGSRPPASSPVKLPRPRNWQEIGVGDLVLFQESLENGWYEALVVEANGDMFTLRWRDWPRARRVGRHRLRLALLYPGPKPPKSVKSSGQSGRDQTNSQPSSAGLPRDWDEIDLDHLILAKTEGPWANWFEAIPIERVGDGFKLRWRDYAALPPAVRPRFELALICPDAK